MAHEYIPVTAGEEGAEATISSKDEQITSTVDENGYESECNLSSRSEEDVARSAMETEADAFTRFIERQRVEVMFELRRLRLGERPVTGQSNRERIETFLNNIQEQDTRAPSIRPAVPSAHLADIDALASRRCVSAALGSAAFRQDLENAVRRSIEPRPVALVQQTPPAPRMHQTFATHSIEQTHSHNITQDPPTVPLRVAPIRRDLERSQNTQILAHEPVNLERQERELHAWQTITQLQREIIVVEITDLVHRQLVTSALESDFRTHLEGNILTRLEQGTPLQQPAPAVVTPRIHPVPASTRRTTNTSTSASTIDELSSRFDHMQQMLQLMFTMQMDMQRTLRHEVASSIANNSLTTMTSSSQPMNAGHCTICLNSIADTVLYRCGHLCVCYMCGLNLQQTTSANGMKCPICRAPVDDILRVYRSSRDGEEI